MYIYICIHISIYPYINPVLEPGAFVTISSSQKVPALWERTKKSGLTVPDEGPGAQNETKMVPK